MVIVKQFKKRQKKLFRSFETIDPVCFAFLSDLRTSIKISCLDDEM